MSHQYLQDMYDPWTGIQLTPGFHGEKCAGNGKHPEYECCCDECDFYLLCFPDWITMDTYDDI